MHIGFNAGRRAMYSFHGYRDTESLEAVTEPCSKSQLGSLEDKGVYPSDQPMPTLSLGILHRSYGDCLDDHRHVYTVSRSLLVDCTISCHL
jgi:hypothetical protein